MNIDVNNLPEEITTKVYPLVSDFGYLVMSQIELSGYTIIGDPIEATFKLHKKDDIVVGIVADLRTKEQEVRVKAELECKHINDKINSLLAISYDGDVK